MLHIRFSVHNGVRAFLYFKELHYRTTCQAAAGSHFPISEKNLQNIPDLWKGETSMPIDLNHKLGCVLFICWYCLVFNLALFGSRVLFICYLFPGDESEAMSFQADVGLGLFSLCSQFRQSPENKMVAPPARGCSRCLWWAHYFWNVSGNEDWSPSRSNSIYCDWGLYVSRHAQLLAVVYSVAEGQWAESRPDNITCL